MTAKPRVKCPQCGARTKKNIGAGAGIIFKGTGFYETDYKRKSGRPEAKSSPPKPGDSKTESPKSDAAKAD
jgi:predicted nucleic acid-binding Zn ribbon protein